MSGEVAKKMGCRLGTFTHYVLFCGSLVTQRYCGSLSRRLVQALPAEVTRCAAATTRSISFLGRIERWMDPRQFLSDGGVELVEIEAYPRHVQNLLAAANLKNDTLVNTCSSVYLCPPKTLVNILLKNSDDIVERCVCAV